MPILDQISTLFTIILHTTGHKIKYICVKREKKRKKKTNERTNDSLRRLLEFLIANDIIKKEKKGILKALIDIFG